MAPRLRPTTGSDSSPLGFLVSVGGGVRLSAWTLGDRRVRAAETLDPAPVLIPHGSPLLPLVAISAIGREISLSRRLQVDCAVRSWVPDIPGLQSKNPIHCEILSSMVAELRDARALPSQVLEELAELMASDAPDRGKIAETLGRIGEESRETT